ncbi:hypothetical protein [Parasphingorhabdus sp.]|uniref:hypothetical protein n=1 Tax=Parasphingorhabdus sp. TaxID=2709688 RepID=UPI003BAFB13D
MAVPKIRFDDQFVEEEKQKTAANSPMMTAADFSDLSDSSSPARELHQQLHQQFIDGSVIQPAEKFSGITSISIITGSSIILWTGLIALALSVYK